MLHQGSDIVALQGSDGSLLNENAIALVDKVKFSRQRRWLLTSDQREHFAAIVGIHPVFQWIASMLPFLRGNKATSALEQLGRRQVLKRLVSPSNREDILGKLIEARGYNTRAPTADEIAELTAESVTLL